MDKFCYLLAILRPVVRTPEDQSWEVGYSPILFAAKLVETRVEDSEPLTNRKIRRTHQKYGQWLALGS